MKLSSVLDEKVFERMLQMAKNVLRRMKVMNTNDHILHGHTNKCIFYRKIMHCDANFTEVSSQGFNLHEIIIGPGNGLAPNKCQAITWTNDDRVNQQIYPCFKVSMNFPSTIYRTIPSVSFANTDRVRDVSLSFPCYGQIACLLVPALPN